MLGASPALAAQPPLLACSARYGTRTDYARGLTEIIDLPLLSMAQEFDRDISWTDWQVRRTRPHPRPHPHPHPHPHPQPGPTDGPPLDRLAGARPHAARTRTRTRTLTRTQGRAHTLREQWEYVHGRAHSELDGSP